MCFVTAKKLSSNLEIPHFLTFSAKHRNFKIRQKDGHGKSRNGHEEVMDKYFVKSVGTLPIASGGARELPDPLPFLVMIISD